MGNQRQYNKDGGFTQYLYKDESDKEIIGGVTCKLVSRIDDPSGTHSGLPKYSSTTEVYLKKGKDGLASQARVYKDRHSFMDIDWSHTHKNPDGTTFPKGTAHVQVYKTDKDGNVVRLSDKARPMTDAEIKKYGPVIKHYNPNVKF